MVMIERDVIVAGAGPAGAICAAYLARAGVDVLLIDKEMFPRDKACGDLIRERFVKHTEKLEVVDVLDEKSTCIRKVKLISGSGNEAVIPFECYALPRYELDSLLVETAKSWGAEFRPGCRVVDVIREGGKVCGVIVREKGVEYQIRSRVVIGADGVNSQIAKVLDVLDEEPSGIWMGARSYFKGIKLDRSLAKEQYDAGGIFGFDDKAGPAYFWVMPVGTDGVKRGLCNVGMLTRDRDACSAEELAARLESWMNSEDVKVMFEDAQKLSSWAFGKLADNTQGRELTGEGYMLIGDAAATVLPLFGDGLGAAADSAKAAADAVEAALKSEDFSGEALGDSYKMSLAKMRPAQTEDEIKLNRLMIESLADPHVPDMIVERLERDPNYAKRR